MISQPLLGPPLCLSAFGVALYSVVESSIKRFLAHIARRARRREEYDGGCCQERKQQRGRGCASACGEWWTHDRGPRGGFKWPRRHRGVGASGHAVICSSYTAAARTPGCRRGRRKWRRSSKVDAASLRLLLEQLVPPRRPVPLLARPEAPDQPPARISAPLSTRIRRLALCPRRLGQAAPDPHDPDAAGPPHLLHRRRVRGHGRAAQRPQHRPGGTRLVVALPPTHTHSLTRATSVRPFDAFYHRERCSIRTSPHLPF